jgi:hypothetical protein
MTPPKTIDQIRDEMAEEYADEYSELCCDIAFKSGFDASTKYHEEKYRKLVVVATSTTNFLNDKIAVIPADSRQRDLHEDDWEHLMFLRDIIDGVLKELKNYEQRI